jgi:Protein of unknown function (DUF2971)
MSLKTIFDNRYLPKETDFIYHYCGELSFLGICKSESIWLSDILEMNDSLEYKWGRDKVTEVLKKHKDEFTQDFRVSLIMGIYSPDSHLRPFICSFSKKGDLLSQWRAYAQDGFGFSIGFSAKKIYENLGVNINSVIYSEKKQEKIILDTIKGLFATWHMDKSKYYEIAISFGIDLAYFKNPSFFEEQEIRIIRLIQTDNDNFIDPGGNSFHKPTPAFSVQKRSSMQSTINYIALPIKDGTDSYIKEVIIGPKNNATVESVKTQLNGIGLSKVVVKKSLSSYR